MQIAKPATTDVPIHDLLAQRWSPRAFDPSRGVTREQRLALLEAARWAPSCFGDEPWRLIVFDRDVDAASWQAAFDCLAEANQAWVRNTSLLIAVCAEGRFRRNGKDNRWAQYDTGAAALSLCLQAVALGLAAHQMGGFDADRLRRVIGIPASVTPMAMVAVGHQAEAAALDTEARARETTPRSRRALDENCHFGTWGVPVSAV